jgi:hypothetical protein
VLTAYESTPFNDGSKGGLLPSYSRYPQKYWRCLFGIADREGDRVGHQLLLHQFQHHYIHHLFQEQEGVIGGIVLKRIWLLEREFLLDLYSRISLDGAGLDAAGIVDEVFRVHTEFLIKQPFAQLGYSIKSYTPYFLQPFDNAFAYIPDVGDRSVAPDGALEFLHI